MKSLALRTAFVVALLAAATPHALRAQWTWSDKAELSFVSSAGNSSATTFGVKNTLNGTGQRSKLAIEIGGIRTESSKKDRVATGSVNNFDVVETTTSEVTAERYYAKGRFDRTVSGTAFAFGGAGWERNTFAGIDDRVSVVAGVGNQWVVRDDFAFRTDLGFTYTIQDNVAMGPTERFGGVRLTSELARSLTDNTDLEHQLVLDENVQNTDDWRIDMTTSISVAMNERLALKTSYQLLFDNNPSLIDVPLVSVPDTTVPVELAKVDTVLTLALVINVR